MILGTGIDIIEVSRMTAMVERFGDRFLRRVLVAREIEYCQGHVKPGPHIAARFAAKEAVSKAFGTGIGASLGWGDIEVAHRPTGAPMIVLHGRGRDLMTSRGARELHVSLSHTEHYAAAFALLEG
ncbi:MAG: holo-ACP synthase [Verrucomicrobiae bacterium]|nr:holo-ACP synthase [Verrucomicrobiae bacterium]